MMVALAWPPQVVEHCADVEQLGVGLDPAVAGL
jgi:hypothetical protein